MASLVGSTLLLGPLNSHCSDHGRACRLTPHHFIHFPVQERTATYFTRLTKGDICRKSETAGLCILLLIRSEPSVSVGGNSPSRVDKGLSSKAPVMGASFHALWFPRWILYRQSQPSARPQAKHYHTATMLHIKQSPRAEIKKEVLRTKTNPPSLRGALTCKVRWPAKAEDMAAKGVNLESAVKFLSGEPGRYQPTVSFFLLQTEHHSQQLPW